MTNANDTSAVTTLFARAVEHHRQGRAAEALMLYNTVLRAAPDNAVVHCNRGNALQALGRLEEAIRTYDHAIRIQPAYVDAYFSKAMALGALKRAEKALQNFDLAIQCKPDHIAARGRRRAAIGPWFSGEWNGVAHVRAGESDRPSRPNLSKSEPLYPPNGPCHYDRSRGAREPCTTSEP